MSDRRAAITGLGIVSSLGTNLAKTWEGITSGRSGIGPITAWDATEFSVRFGGECTDFVTSDWVSRREERRLDRFTQLAIAAADMAIEDSGLDLDKTDRTRVGCILGSGIGGLGEIETQHGGLVDKGPRGVSPMLVPKMMVNAAPGQVSIRHGLLGPNLAVVTACASAAHAMGDALNVIRRKEAEVVVAGGSEAAMTPLSFAGFSNLKALSTRNDDPEIASRPFDRDRDGFVMGEGAGIIILEEMEYAKARGARIYAELAGFGMSADGCHITMPDPDGIGPANAMKFALQDAGMNPDEVDYVNAHGTSTPLNDKGETQAIRKIFGDHADKLAVSSNKSQFGHALGASGGLEVVVSAYGMLNDIIPPTVNYTTPDPDCDLDYVPNEARDQSFDVALSNSFGFGGHNGTVIIKKLD
ncbi:MAG: beta-ketoacyl-ACP synthase II [Planctomycetota bacterium]|jgi:3-oxoacyl-[acyl-carrier-protein] synthase II|nr:beta-ketoacyl-ACP synthase II [Planctomycetota bacterium]MDP7253627.1 beta-ketoacyl-ACP synthase II [Planctomycetota bacterium]